MGSKRLSVEEIVEYYKPDVESLEGFIPWLKENKGSQTTTIYGDEEISQNSITFPVYDETLMRFVKTAQASSLIDRNYVYVYSRNRIRTVQDERRLIKRATIREMGDLWGILSRYIIKGRTKAALWSEGVRNGIFLELLLKMKELLIFWDKHGKEN